MNLAHLPTFRPRVGIVFVDVCSGVGQERTERKNKKQTRATYFFKKIKVQIRVPEHTEELMVSLLISIFSKIND